MKMIINIDNDVSNIQVWDGKDYLRITNIGEETNLQTTLKSEEVNKFIQSIGVYITSELTKPLIKESQMKTSPRSLIIDKATGDELRALSEMINVTKGLED